MQAERWGREAVLMVRRRSTVRFRKGLCSSETKIEQILDDQFGEGGDYWSSAAVGCCSWWTALLDAGHVCEHRSLRIWHSRMPSQPSVTFCDWCRSWLAREEPPHKDCVAKIGEVGGRAGWGDRRAGPLASWPRLILVLVSVASATVWVSVIGRSNRWQDV